MKVIGKCFVNLEAEIAKVPDHNPEITLDGNGVLWVKVYEREKSFKVRLDCLTGEREANEKMAELLIWRLGLFAGKAGWTKAEAKRRLIRCGVISK
ncbi:hypothetical protein SDC9_11692 [bioreactor metagenome]|uniref:Uncharacterized protein n=1 Tax=bioreactor metagenome TaxID=1076179 RepID=A0A644TGP4_9ZZZZ